MTAVSPALRGITTTVGWTSPAIGWVSVRISATVRWPSAWIPITSIMRIRVRLRRTAYRNRLWLLPGPARFIWLPSGRCVRRRRPRVGTLPHRGIRAVVGGSGGEVGSFLRLLGGAFRRPVDDDRSRFEGCGQCEGENRRENDGALVTHVRDGAVRLGGGAAAILNTPTVVHPAASGIRRDCPGYDCRTVLYNTAWLNVAVQLPHKRKCECAAVVRLLLVVSSCAARVLL